MWQYVVIAKEQRIAPRGNHGLEALLTQRVYGIILGYEDANDHEYLTVPLWTAPISLPG